MPTELGSRESVLPVFRQMVNYDLPWNPNRLEQRFGRIHRIGQTEVCHLWNLVTDETREGDVYQTLLEKLEQARQTLGGQVFDVLGKLQFEGQPLRDLLIAAIRVPAPVRHRDRLIGIGDPVLPRWICCWNAIAICRGGERCWLMSAILACHHGCCSLLSMPFRTRPSPPSFPAHRGLKPHGDKDVIPGRVASACGFWVHLHLLDNGHPSWCDLPDYGIKIIISGN